MGGSFRQTCVTPQATFAPSRITQGPPLSLGQRRGLVGRTGARVGEQVGRLSVVPDADGRGCWCPAPRCADCASIPPAPGTTTSRPSLSGPAGPIPSLDVRPSESSTIFQRLLPTLWGPFFSSEWHAAHILKTAAPAPGSAFASSPDTMPASNPQLLGIDTGDSVGTRRASGRGATAFVPWRGVVHFSAATTPSTCSPKGCHQRRPPAGARSPAPAAT